MNDESLLAAAKLLKERKVAVKDVVLVDDLDPLPAKWKVSLYRFAPARKRLYHRVREKLLLMSISRETLFIC